MQHSMVIDFESLKQMADLEAQTPGPKITIYFSVPAASNYAIVGRAKLKAAVHEAMMQMEASQVPSATLTTILNELSLLDSPELWTHRSESYAFFVSAQLARWYALPLPVQDKMIVSNQFDLSPLLPFLSLPEHFFILDVSLGKPRMAQVHPQFLVPMKLESVWKFLESLGKEDIVHNRSFHTAGAARNGHSATIPHGAGQDTEFHRVDRYFQIFAHEIDLLLHNSREPLVLLGTTPSIAALQKYLLYSNVLVFEGHLEFPSGNPIQPGTSVWFACAKLY